MEGLSSIYRDLFISVLRVLSDWPLGALVVDPWCSGLPLQEISDVSETSHQGAH